MISSLLEMKAAFDEIRDTDHDLAALIPSETAFEMLKYMLPYMECVKTASEKLSADNQTLPICLPMISELQGTVERLISGYDHGQTNLSEREEEALVTALRAFNDSLTLRMRKQASEEIYAIGAVLHPYYRGVPLHKLGMYDDVVKKMIENHPSTKDFRMSKSKERSLNQPEQLSEEQLRLLPVNDYEVYIQEQRRIQQLQATNKVSSQPPIMVEIQRYNEMPRPKKTDDPLVWWSRSESHLPLLSEMVRNYFAIPVTSSPSERVFSTGGRIVTPSRSNLSPESICKTTFIEHNYDRIEMNILKWDYRNRVSNVFFLFVFYGRKRLFKDYLMK